MDMLKKFFPFSFNFKAKDVKGLIISLLIYIVAGGVAGFVLGLLGNIAVIGLVFQLIGWALSIYTTVGIVLSVLVFLDILK